MNATCQIAIVLVASDDTFVARRIDEMTGKGGWTHVYLDTCDIDEAGEPVAISYTLARGVHRMDPRVYKSDRKQVRIVLDPSTAYQVAQCVRARVGAPFRLLDLLRGVESEGTCVGLVTSCMPAWLRERIESVKVGPCVSPNAIATYFGVGTP